MTLGEAWSTGAFFRDLTPRYYGASEVTTALCLEFLVRRGDPRRYR